MPSNEPARDRPEVLACGDDLVAVDLGDTRESQALAEYLRESGEWIECVAGMAGCVAQFDNVAIDLQTAKQRLAAAIGSVPDVESAETELVEVPVCYGGSHGPDLENVCSQIGMSPEAFIELHTGREFRVDLLGFTPGFAFIGGPDELRDLPRRPEPRMRLEPGSVGVAAGRTGIYALPGPGGWSIVGRTPATLFEATAAQPFRLRPGMRVRFAAISPEQFDANASR